MWILILERPLVSPEVQHSCCLEVYSTTTLDVRKGGSKIACVVEETLSKLKAITHMRARTSTQALLVFSSSAKWTKKKKSIFP